MMRGIVIVATLAAMAAAGRADLITTTVRVRAWIDGQDYLHLSGSSVRWEHLSYRPAGDPTGPDEPTYLTTTVNGSAVMTDYAWTPAWPDGTGSGKWSSTFEGLNPPIPDDPEVVSVNVIRAPGYAGVIQTPTAGNGWETVIDFNDKAWGGATWYDIEVTFTGTPEPAGLALLAGGAVALLRRRR